MGHPGPARMARVFLGGDWGLAGFGVVYAFYGAVTILLVSFIAAMASS